MDLADRLARRKGRREDLAAAAGLLAFLAAILAIVILPGFLVQSASTSRVPAQQEARR